MSRAFCTEKGHTLILGTQQRCYSVESTRRDLTFKSETLAEGLLQRSPLARVWLAATLERKVTKHHFLSASIPKSVEAIVAVEMVPMALRLSGQLLLGVARMYSRKAKYLMDDATETLSRVKIAFRAGGSRNKDVDLATDQQTAHKNAITLQNTNSNEFDAIYQDMQYRSWFVHFLPALSIYRH